MENEPDECNPIYETCKERKTKYRCIVCEFPVCNVCSRSADKNVFGYSEENKMVGICQSCDLVSETTFTTSSSDAEVIHEKEKNSEGKIILVRQKYFSPASEPSRKKTENIGLDVSR